MLSNPNKDYHKQLIRLVITLAALWLLLSGMFEPLQLLLGAISVVLVSYLSVRLEVLMHEGQPLYFRLSKVLQYLAWLIVEILKSNIYVMKLIFHPALPIDPLLKAVPARQKTELGRVFYANSITLTPGTVAINIAVNGDILVHALHRDSMEELETGIMDEKIRQLEPEQPPGDAA